MGDIGDHFNAIREANRIHGIKNLLSADPEGWTIHTDYHWSRDLLGSQLDYWPSRNKFRWRGKTHVGDVKEFIQKQEAPDE